MAVRLLDAGTHLVLHLPDLENVGVSGRSVHDLPVDDRGEVRDVIVAHEIRCDSHGSVEGGLAVAYIRGRDPDISPELTLRGIDDCEGDDVVRRTRSVLVHEELELLGAVIPPAVTSSEVYIIEGAAEVVVVSQTVGSVGNLHVAGDSNRAGKTRDGDNRRLLLKEGVRGEGDGEGVVPARVGRALSDILGAEEGRVDLQGLGITLRGHLSIRGTGGTSRPSRSSDGASRKRAASAAQHAVGILVHRQAIHALAAEGSSACTVSVST